MHCTSTVRCDKYASSPVQVRVGAYEYHNYGCDGRAWVCLVGGEW